ncbi:TPA: hypothetical protein ACPP54_001365 [Haemophilus influenzae]
MSELTRAHRKRADRCISDAVVCNGSGE